MVTFSNKEPIHVLLLMIMEGAVIITAPFNNMPTWKFKIQPTISVTLLSITAADL